MEGPKIYNHLIEVFHVQYRVFRLSLVPRGKPGTEVSDSFRPGKHKIGPRYLGTFKLKFQIKRIVESPG